MMKFCPFCKVRSQFRDEYGDRHKLGCPAIWEEIFRNAGDWWNARLAKIMQEDIIAFENQKALANLGGYDA